MPSSSGRWTGFPPLVYSAIFSSSSWGGIRSVIVPAGLVGRVLLTSEMS